MIYYYTTHVSYITTKSKSTIYNMNTQNAHELDEDLVSRRERSGTQETETSRSARQRKLDLLWTAPLQSKLRNLNIQIQGSQDLPNK